MADNTDGGLFGKRDCNVMDNFYERLYENILYQDSYMIMPLLLRPKSRGYVKLRTRFINDQPIIVPNYFDDPHDLDVLVIKRIDDWVNNTESVSDFIPLLLIESFRNLDKLTGIGLLSDNIVKLL